MEHIYIRLYLNYGGHRQHQQVSWPVLCPPPLHHHNPLLAPYAPNSYIKALAFNVTILGDKAFREVIKVKWSHRGGALIHWICDLIRRGRDSGVLSLPTHKRKSHVRTQRECGPLQPGRELSPGTSPESTLILDFQPLELWENKCCLSHPVCSVCYESASRWRQK